MSSSPAQLCLFTFVQTRELPVLTEISEEEKRIAQLQTGFATRLKSSPYYIVEVTKSTGKQPFLLQETYYKVPSRASSLFG
jgi:hypothetical protein